MSTESTSTTTGSILNAGAALIHGEVIDRSRVVDVLLDLRNAAAIAAQLGVVEAVDFALRSVPGRTTVRTSWWQGTLDELQLAVELDGEREKV